MPVWYYCIINPQQSLVCASSSFAILMPEAQNCQMQTFLFFLRIWFIFRKCHFRQPLFIALWWSIVINGITFQLLLGLVERYPDSWTRISQLKWRVIYWQFSTANCTPAFSRSSWNFCSLLQLVLKELGQ